MERLTVAECSDGRFRLIVNHGGSPYWCMFDFAVLPVPGEVHIVLSADAEDVSAEWFPHIRQGMLRGLEAARENGREWIGVRIEIRKIHTHPIATSPRGCERYGFMFVFDELPRRGVPVPE